jgi:hypothetical protein
MERTAFRLILLILATLTARKCDGIAQHTKIAIFWNSMIRHFRYFVIKLAKFLLALFGKKRLSAASADPNITEWNRISLSAWHEI